MSRTELGGLLISRGLISRSQLETALEHQQSFGGRLGTCLLEVGALDERTLLAVLSEQLRVPTATQDELKNLPTEMVSLLPRSVALACSAVPFRRSADRIDVALLDPGDLALEDEISFSMGKRIRPHLASELRITEALHEYYGGAKPLRFGSLMDRIAHEGEVDGPARVEPNPIPDHLRPGSDDDTPVSRLRHFEPPMVEKQSISLTDEERRALAASRGPRLSVVPEARETVQPPEAVERSEFGQLLSEAETASRIGEVLLRILSDRFSRVLLFRVSSGHGEVGGWMSHGPEVDQGWLRHYSVGLHHATVFRDLADGAPLFAGRLEATPAHKALARCWGGFADLECLFLPINVRGRLVCAAYLDRGDAGLKDVDFNFLERLARMTALAFERCILRRKLQTT